MSTKLLLLKERRQRLLKELEEVDSEIKKEENLDSDFSLLAVSRFDRVSPEDIAYLEDEHAANPYCKDVKQHPVTADELYEAIKPMGGKSPWEYSDSELDQVIHVLRGAIAIHMPGSSKEAQAAVASFYGEFSELVEQQPRLAAELGF
jgi:hypothetical protein